MYKSKVHCLATELRRPNHAVALTTDVEGGEVRVKLDLVNQLVYRLRTKELSVKNLAKYPAEVLWPEGPYAAAMIASRKKELEREKAKTLDDDYVGMFKCGKCKSNKTTFYLLQTRSADEPMTAYITCLGCGCKWKS
jgi:DNA-directed RNA polymerase subunit M/transcription elongation factor TFIIS